MPPLNQPLYFGPWHLTALGSDVSAFLHHAVISSWQDEWTNIQGNKLRAVKPSVRVWNPSFSSIRRDELILTRHRIGHTRLTNGHLLHGVPAPFFLAYFP
jgi:hypothetical protein